MIRILIMMQESKENFYVVLNHKPENQNTNIQQELKETVDKLLNIDKQYVTIKYDKFASQCKHQQNG